MTKRVRKRKKSELESLESEFERRDRAREKVIRAFLKACNSVSKSRRQTIANMANSEWINDFDQIDDDDAFEAESKKWDRLRSKFLRECSDPYELHLFAFGWNWDDGIDSLQKLVKNKSCDAGTALMVYWYSSPEFYTQYKAINDCPEYNRDPMKLSRSIERKLKRGVFASRLIPFDPTPWVSTEYKDCAVREIPPVMLDPIEIKTKPRKKK